MIFSNRLIINGDNVNEVIQTICPINEHSGCNELDFRQIKQVPADLDFLRPDGAHRYIELYLTSVNPLINYYGDMNEKVNKTDYFDFYAEINNQGEKGYFYNDRLPVNEIEQSEKILFEKEGLSREQILFMGEKLAINLLYSGSLDYYDWVSQNWGTEENSISSYIQDNVIYFETNNNTVCELMRALSELFSENEFIYEYAGDIPGELAGRMILDNGEEVLTNYYSKNSAKAYETYFKMFGRGEEFEFDVTTGTYRIIVNDESSEETEDYEYEGETRTYNLVRAEM